MKLLIGIDPGVHTGVAVYNTDSERLIGLITTDFWSASSILRQLKKGYEIKSVIEDPSQNRPVFIRPGATKGEMIKIAQNVGMNKKEGLLWIEFCKRNSIPFLASKPTKNSNTKLDAVMFGKLTGWNKRSSEHSRDAAMLVFGLKWEAVK